MSSSLRHRPDAPPHLAFLLHTDSFFNSKGTIGLPTLQKTPLPVLPDEPAVGRQPFELLLWLAVFCCTRESPLRAVQAVDVPRTLDGTLHSSTASPGSLRSSSPANRGESFMQRNGSYSTVGGDVGAESTHIDVGDDVQSEAESSGTNVCFADAPLAPTLSQCKSIIRALRMCLGVTRVEQLQFNAEALQRWICSPQQFGASVRRLEDLVMKPPQSRRRRDAVYRAALVQLLGNSRVVWHMWWCSGVYADIFNGSSFPLRIDDLPHGDSWTTASSNHSAGRQSTISSSTEQGGTATTLMAKQRSSELDALQSIASAILFAYLDGALTWIEQESHIITTASTCKSVHLRGMTHATFAVPCVIRSPPCSSMLSTLTLARCGLCDLSGIDACASLQVLRLDGNRITALPRAFWHHLRCLRELDLSSNLLTCLGIESLGGSEGSAAFVCHSTSSIDGLESLSLAFNLLEDAAVVSWFCCPGLFRSLACLDLSGNCAVSLTSGSTLITWNTMLAAAPQLKRLMCAQTQVRRSVLPHLPVPPPTRQRDCLHIVFAAEIPTAVVVNSIRRRWTLRLVVAHVMNIVFLFREARRISTSGFLSSLGGNSSRAVSMSQQPASSNVRTRLSVKEKCNAALRFSSTTVTTAIEATQRTDPTDADEASAGLCRLLGRKRVSSLRLGRH